MNDPLEPEKILSVCIPTYNRIGLLRNTLGALLPQLDGRCELVILDNHSVPMVAEGIADILPLFPDVQVRIIRHSANIGANANILRCFEHARGQWIWVLGDDDKPVDSAVQNILQETAEHPLATYFNFVTGILDEQKIARSKTRCVEGFDGFVRELDYWGNVLFISAGVYRRAALLPFLRDAYSFIYSCGPHLALLTIALRRSGGLTVFSDKRTVTLENRDRNVFDWNGVRHRLFQMLDLIPDPELREIWYAKTRRSAPAEFLPAREIFLRVVKNRGNLDPVLDELRVLGQVAALVPSMRVKLLEYWTVARMATVAWLPFYLLWRLKRKLGGKTSVPAGKHRPGWETAFDDERL